MAKLSGHADVVTDVAFNPLHPQLVRLLSPLLAVGIQNVLVIRLTGILMIVV
jgi:hypothetical protein